MTYPLDQLTLIAPIIFIILIVAFPLIGLLAGWKRGLYWGGGNLFFYVTGLLLWRFIATPIASALGPTIYNLLQGFGFEFSADITGLAASFLTPVFFMIWMLISNIALLINYFAWYKRVVGLQKPKQQKGADGKQKAVKVQVNTKQGGKAKAINMFGGALCLGALTVPTSIAFTNTVFYLTTSKATRVNNSLANNLYGGLHTLQSGVSWFSYYSIGGVTDSAKDFDALYSGLAMLSKQITYVPIGGGQEETATLYEAISDTFTQGLTDVFKETSERLDGEQTLEQAQDIAGAINNMAETWNYLMDNYENDITPLFNSDNGAQLVAQIIDGAFGKDQEINQSMIDNYIGDDNIFDKVVQGYTSEDGNIVIGEETVHVDTLQPVYMSESSFEAMSDVIMGTFKFDEKISETEKDAFKNKIDTLISMVFQVQ